MAVPGIRPTAPQFTRTYHPFHHKYAFDRSVSKVTAPSANDVRSSCLLSPPTLRLYRQSCDTGASGATGQAFTAAYCRPGRQAFKLKSGRERFEVRAYLIGSNGFMARITPHFSVESFHHETIFPGTTTPCPLFYGTVPAKRLLGFQEPAVSRYVFTVATSTVYC